MAVGAGLGEGVGVGGSAVTQAVRINKTMAIDNGNGYWKGKTEATLEEVLDAVRRLEIKFDEQSQRNDERFDKMNSRFHKIYFIIGSLLAGGASGFAAFRLF